jgi:hypothetical protein
VDIGTPLIGGIERRYLTGGWSVPQERENH